MSAENAPIIIKKKKVIAGGGHHGGAWKVAYADFVTAMMAFFLLMWLLSSTSEEQRKGIADFFSPRVPLSETSGGGAQLLNGQSAFTTEQLLAAGVGGKTDDRENDKEHDPANPPGAGDADKEHETPSLEQAYKALEAAKEEVQDALNAFKQSASDNALLEHLSLRITAEGLVIEIADVAGQPLFANGSAQPSPKLTRQVEMVAPIVAELENQVAVVGHTDSSRFVNPGRYGNWELSIDRANAARRLLTGFGLPEARIEKVTGAADRDPLSDDPSAPQNRRIGVILLKRPLKEEPRPAPKKTPAGSKPAPASHQAH